MENKSANCKNWQSNNYASERYSNSSPTHSYRSQHRYNQPPPNFTKPPKGHTQEFPEKIDPPQHPMPSVQYHPSDPRSRLFAKRQQNVPLSIPPPTINKETNSNSFLSSFSGSTDTQTTNRNFQKTLNSNMNNNFIHKQESNSFISSTAPENVVSSLKQERISNQLLSNINSIVPNSTNQETKHNTNTSRASSGISISTATRGQESFSQSTTKPAIEVATIKHQAEKNVSKLSIKPDLNTSQEKFQCILIESKKEETEKTLEQPKNPKSIIRITDPSDIPPNSTKFPTHLKIHHSTPLPTDVQHIISTIYTDTCPRPRRIRDFDPCGCTPNRSFPFACSDEGCVLFACQEECGPNCLAGDTCRNRRITRMQWKKLEVFDASLKGRGLRAKEKIKKGDFITEYVGVAILKKELDDLFRQYKNQQMLYIMALDNDVYLDARTKGSVARYINHGCEPNCKVDRWKVQGITRTCVFALRDIEDGEELMFDYKWDRRRGRAPTKCYCMAPTCRGTLELKKDKDLEEEEIEMKLKGYWKKPNFNEEVKGDVVNRVIKVYFEGNQEYFVGDVCKYDPETKMHMIMYKTDMDEAWEDLNKVEWMILDEEAEHIVIKRKVKKIENTEKSPETEQMERQFQSLPKPAIQNYVIVENLEREELAKSFIIDKCQRYFRVHVNIIPCIRNNSVVPAEEAMEEEKILDKAKDGKAWKLSIVGLDPMKALNYLQKNVDMLRMSKGVNSNQPASITSATHIVSRENKTDGVGLLAHSSSATNLNSMDGARVGQEMVIPRLIADEVKKNLFTLRSKCWNVTINFKTSQTRSKVVARLLLSAILPHDLKRGQKVLWMEMLRMCTERGFCGSGGNEVGLPRELGFLGGELEQQDWEKFLGCGEDYEVNLKGKKSLSSYEIMKQKITSSKTLTDFQQTQKCTIWIQPELQSSINNSTRISEEKDVARIFIGCAPDRVPDVWFHITSRIADLKRGVKFYPLPKDIRFQNLLQEQNPKWNSLAKQTGDHNQHFTCESLFDFIKCSIGANVKLDPSTNSHLRIEMDREQETSKEINDNLKNMNSPVHQHLPNANFDNPDNKKSSSDSDNSILTAENILQTQLNIFTDNLERKQQWMFGRDWALLENASIPLNPSEYNSFNASQSYSSTMFSTKSSIDMRGVPTSVEEISDIVSDLSLHSTVAAHAAVIFYRYMHIFKLNSLDLKSEFKLRELLTACVYIANKSQKVTKWKKLEVVLQAAYRIFYSGRSLTIESEEAKRLEMRTLEAEKLILETLHYDVFWEGVDWVISATTSYIPRDIANRAMEIVLSKPMLLAGPQVWLWSGAIYVFAVTVGFARHELLRPLISLMELDASKMVQIAELLKSTINSMSKNQFDELGKTGRLYKALDSKVSENMVFVKSICMAEITAPMAPEDTLKNYISLSDEQTFIHEMKEDSQFEKEIQNVDMNFISQKILPSLSSIFSKSGCSIYFKDIINSNPPKETIKLEGTWRSIAAAEMALEKLSSNPNSVVAKDEINSIVDEFSIGQFDINNVSIDSASPTLSISSSSTLSASLPKHLSNSIKSHSDDGMKSTRTKLDRSESRMQPCILGTADLNVAAGTVNGSRSLETKVFLCGNIADQKLIKANLRWWLAPRLGVDETGSLCDVLTVLLRGNESKDPFLNILADFLHKIGCKKASKEQLVPKADDDKSSFFDVSFQRWPSKKAETKERLKTDKKKIMNMGFSATALQEMQLLCQIHKQIPIPRGHPNFCLPIALSTPSLTNEKMDESDSFENAFDTSMENSMLAHNMMSNIFEEKHNRKKSQDSELCKESFFLVFERTPVALHKVVAHSKKRRKSSSKTKFISPALFAAWFYDILTALTYSHMNNMVLRTVHAEQVLINEIGEAKVSNLVRTLVLPHDEREKNIDPLSSARSAKKMGVAVNDELCNNPYISPEMLLGCPRYTKESDVWSIGCLMAHLLVNKSLFSGCENRNAHVKAIFKVVGTPSKENYPDAKRYPNYEKSKPGKDYKKGVRKAFQFHLKDCKEDTMKEYEGAMDLLERMLDLDPKKRIKPLEALKHPYMKNFASKRKTRLFRQQFQHDWMKLKMELLREQNGSSGNSKKLQIDKPKFKSLDSLRKDHEKRRKHMLLEATKIGDDDDDDLYNLDEEDLLNFGVQSSSRKRLKTLHNA